MNNTIETNQSYQKFKEILLARHIISRWLSARSGLLCQVISQPASQPPHQPVTRRLLFGATPTTLNYTMVKVFFARRITKSDLGCS